MFWKSLPKTPANREVFWRCEDGNSPRQVKSHNIESTGLIRKNENRLERSSDRQSRVHAVDKKRVDSFLGHGDQGMSVAPSSLFSFFRIKPFDSRIACTTKKPYYYFVDCMIARLSTRASSARQAIITLRPHFHSTGACVFLYNCCLWLSS